MGNVVCIFRNVTMIENYLLLITGAFYLLGAISLFLSPLLRKWIWALGSIVFAILLSGIALLTQFSLFSNPVEVKIVNYSSRSGSLYFLQTVGEEERIRYEKAVNANEESSMKVEKEGWPSDAVLFLSKNEIRKVPVQEQADGKLDIWEKELQPAEKSYRPLLQDWQDRQQRYSIAIGGMFFWFLLHFIYLRYAEKKSQRRAKASRTSLSAGKV